MSNLDNLTSKIIKDAEVKKTEILNEANTKADTIIKNKIEEAKIKASSILEKASIESKTIRNRIISKNDLEIRNKKLEAKQKVISSVFDIAKNNLENMNFEDFTKFFKSSIYNLDLNGDEEIILSDSDEAKLPKDILQEINSEFKTKNKLGNLTYSNKSNKVHGGFIISKNGIEINYSFEELVDSLKYELEFEIGKILFLNQ